MPVITSLKQGSFFTTIGAVLHDDHLLYYKKIVGHYVEAQVPFESLSLRTSRTIKSDYWTLMVGLLFTAISIYIIILWLSGLKSMDTESLALCFVMMILGAALALTSRNTKIFVHTHDGQAYEFMAFSPSQKEVDEFVVKLQETVKSTVVKKYTVSAGIEPQEYLYRLDFLLQNNYITADEFEDFVKKANTNKIVVKGFGKS